jgi:hypothetical protein
MLGPPMPIGPEELRHLIGVCDPNRPLSAGDPLYVAFDEGTPVRGQAGRSCIDALHRLVLLQDETCQLFTGFPGTGKTTELKRLKQRLEAQRDLPTFVVYVDFEHWLDRYTPVSITDVLRVVAHVLDREASIAEGKDPDQDPAYLQRLWDFLAHTDVELQKIGFSAYGASLMLELKNNPTFHHKAEAALRVRFQQFATEARSAMQQAILRLRQAPATHAGRIVVLADGLEKFTPLREEDRGVMEASVEGVFVQHARLLRLPCHVVYTFPLWLRFRVAELGGLYDGSPTVLPMVRIAEPDGRPYPAGVDKLVDLVRRRVRDLPRVFGDDLEATLLPLLHASGGYPRDLLRMVRQLLIDARNFPVGRSETARIIDELSHQYAFVVRGTNLPLLKLIATTHALPQEDAEQVAAFGRLLERWLVLAYRNGEEWYDLHPLVRRAPIVRSFLEE